MERNGNSDKNQKTKNLNLESLKDDYKALLDKLACPNCKSEQSFDEYYEKIRDCRRCNEKFTKSKISKSSTFERKNKENEEKRLLKLKAVDDAIYGTLGKSVIFDLLSFMLSWFIIYFLVYYFFISM